MNISSVSTSVPAAAPNTVSRQSDPERKDTPSDEARARAEQPPQRAALPPGQGTRVDVLV